ncbi:Uncharacterised protein [Porphyromonas cangingivalis]|uniref:SIR2 family protein n=1 Tax=Porphyromonas cangingivalis TaxID=36874 RepID=UPI000D9C262B|nr:SIR2 family protein [Porphyromonas cangingivalis]SPY36129.1 Uncharacterised protein [Porphyromonas cangingivalis]
MKINIPVELKNAIEEDNLVLFIGAGVSSKLKNSKGCNIGTWKDLVKAILDFLGKQGYDVGALIQLVEQYPPMKILDLIECMNDLSLHYVGDFVKEYFTFSKNSRYPLHKKLYQLSHVIVTTNYDTAFENAIPLLRSQKAYKGKNHELARFRQKDASLLFKLHGCSDDFGSMVLFPSSYRELYETDSIDAEHVLWALMNIVYSKTILFIGTGMEDHQINNIFKKISKLLGRSCRKHYIVTTKKDIDSSLKDFLSPVTIDSYDKLGKLIDELIKIRKDKENSTEVQTYNKQKGEFKAELDRLNSELDANANSRKK